MIKRFLQDDIGEGLSLNPAVAILGPRQVGKTTLALEIAKSYKKSLYLDLESPSDLAKLQNPEAYLYDNRDKLIILDEIQRTPNLFLVLRGLIDRARQEGKGQAMFLILGSCSSDLIQQSAESLAGRIQYLELTNFSALEIKFKNHFDKLWLRGGFPLSYLASTERASFLWLESFIKTYLERDIPQLAHKIPTMNLYRLWVMLAHLQGTNINIQQLASNLDLSHTTIQRYINLFCDLLLIRRLNPFFSNIKKRLIKSPKIYLRDSGILHQLLGINTKDTLLSHPILGKSYEGFVIENIISCLSPSVQVYYYRTLVGAEIDLIIEFSNQERWAIEIKHSSNPKVPKGFYSACDDIQVTKAFLVYNGQESFPLPKGITAINLIELMQILKKRKNDLN